MTIENYGYGDYFGNYFSDGNMGDYNSDLQRLRTLVFSGSPTQLRTISNLAANIAEVTTDGRLKDDLNTIALEASDFASYSHSNPWQRWQSYLRDVGMVASSSITGNPADVAQSPLETSFNTDTGSDGDAAQMKDEEDNTRILLLLAILATLVGLGYYLYSTGAINLG